MLNFKGKVVWITGASSGIGEQLCKTLAEDGALIILSSRNETKLISVKERLTKAEQHKILPLDLADLGDFEELAEKARALFGRIDVLINNGGISQRGLAKDTLLEVDRRIMEVDYFGAVALTKAVLPHFLENRSGMIVNISSIAGKLGVSMRSAYSGAKHALIGFMDCLRSEVFEHGISVVNVCPGFIKTNLSHNALKGDMQPYAKMDNEIDNGMPVEMFVDKMLRQIAKGKEEIIIAEGLPKLGYHAKRLFPQSFIKLSRKLYKRKD